MDVEKPVRPGVVFRADRGSKGGTVMKPGRHELRGVVLKRIDYQESDLIVAFFTRRWGHLRGLAKHGRKSRRRFGRSLTPTAEVDLEFTLKPGRDLVFLERSEAMRWFDRVLDDASRLGRAGAALEMVEGFYPPWVPDPAVYDLLIWFLEGLNQSDRPDELLLMFVIKLLGHAGFGPNLSQCLVCGRPPGADHEMALRPDEGGLVCDACRPGGLKVGLGAVRTIDLIQTTSLDGLNRVRIGPVIVNECRPFVLAGVRRALGRELKSLRFLDQMTGR
jgi:DNA repair protein RecO (recombination protein O)